MFLLPIALRLLHLLEGYRICFENDYKYGVATPQNTDLKLTRIDQRQAIQIYHSN